MRHIFLKKLHFGFFQTFEGSIKEWIKLQSKVMLKYSVYTKKIRLRTNLYIINENGL